MASNIRTSWLRGHQKATRSSVRMIKVSLCLFLLFVLSCSFGLLVHFPMSVSDNDVQPSTYMEDPHSKSYDRPLIVGTHNYTQLSFDMPYESAWRQHAHLVVFGVLATDKPERQEMRNNQRSTWLRYPDVATRSNAFEGLMLVLYAIAPRVSIAPNISLSLADEMRIHHDVLMLRMKEEAPTGHKIIGAHGGYGLPVQVSNARKRFFFMLYAYNTFPSAPFIAKGDDDSYVYVPEYLRMLRQLPRINTIYGAVTKDKKDYPDHPRRTALGMGYTVTRDILREAVSEPTVNEVLIQPYSSSLNDRYLRAYFQHEDAVIGKAMEKVYDVKGVVRALPNVPPEDARLPAVEGWGKAYMAYVLDPQHVPHTGRAINDDGRYNLTYSFPEPNTLHAGNVLWVNDLCRIKERRLPNMSDTTRTIIAHRPVTAEEYKLHWDYHELVGEDAKMQRPYHVEMRNEGFFIDVSLLGVGPCNTKI